MKIIKHKPKRNSFLLHHKLPARENSVYILITGKNMVKSLSLFIFSDAEIFTERIYLQIAFQLFVYFVFNSFAKIFWAKFHRAVFLILFLLHSTHRSSSSKLKLGIKIICLAHDKYSQIFLCSKFRRQHFMHNSSATHELETSTTENPRKIYGISSIGR